MVRGYFDMGKYGPLGVRGFHNRVQFFVSHRDRRVPFCAGGAVMIALAILWGGITALMAGLIWLTIYASTEIHDILKGE